MDPRVILDGERYALECLAKCFPTRKPVIFDVGANVGDYANEVVAWFPNAKLTCFEPQPQAYAELTKWAKRRFVRTEQLALSSEPGEMMLFATDNPVCYLAGLYRSYDPPSQQMVDRPVVAKAVTLDNYCQDQEIDRINLLKLDVEGHEPEVLKGADFMTVTHSIDVIQWEMSDVAKLAGWTFNDMWHRLKIMGFHTYLEDDFKLRPITEPTDEFEGIKHYVNMLSVSNQCKWWKEC